MGCQFALAAMGIDPLNREGPSSSEEVMPFALTMLALAVAQTLLLAVAMAPLLVAVLRHLNMRERGVDFVDALLLTPVLVVVDVAKGIIIALDRILFASGSLFLSDVAAGTWFEYFSWFDLVLPLLVLALSYLYVRVWTAPAAALRDRNLGFPAAWRATKGQVWRSFGYALLLVFVTRGAMALFGWSASQLPEAPDIATLQDASQPVALLRVGIKAFYSTALGMFSLAAVAFALFKLTQQRSER